MGSLTFLKKLGQILVKVAGIAVGIGPIITPFLGSGQAGAVAGKVTNDLTAVGQLVVQVETAFAAIPGAKGEQKLAALIPLAANIVKTSELVSGKKIADEELFTKGVTSLAQGVVDILNAIHPDEAKHAA